MRKQSPLSASWVASQAVDAHAPAPSPVSPLYVSPQSQSQSHAHDRRAELVFSVVIPAYNEEVNLRPTIERLHAALTAACILAPPRSSWLTS